jgi:hypothetical protein
VLVFYQNRYAKRLMTDGIYVLLNLPNELEGGDTIFYFFFFLLVVPVKPLTIFIFFLKEGLRRRERVR